MYKKPLFLDGRERLAMRRSGQDLFLPRARFKTKGDSELRSCCVLHSSDLYVEESKRVYIYKLKQRHPPFLF